MSVVKNKKAQNSIAMAFVWQWVANPRLWRVFNTYQSPWLRENWTFGLGLLNLFRIGLVPILLSLPTPFKPSSCSTLYSHPSTITSCLLSCFTHWNVSSFMCSLAHDRCSIISCCVYEQMRPGFWRRGLTILGPERREIIVSYTCLSPSEPHFCTSPNSVSK